MTETAARGADSAPARPGSEAQDDASDDSGTETPPAPGTAAGLPAQGGPTAGPTDGPVVVDDDTATPDDAARPERRIPGDAVRPGRGRILRGAARAGRPIPDDAARPERRIPVPSLRVAIVVYAVALAALWVSPMGHHWNHVDILVYRQGGLAVLHGKGLYVPSFNHSELPFTYPPISALLFIVLGPLSNYTAPLFATVCSLALLPLTLRFALRLAPFSRWLSASEATRLGLTAAAAAIWFEPLWTTLRYGQINVLIAALILFDLSRSDDRRWKGVAIGVAAGLKMTPLIFIVYLAATRRYRAAATALAGFVGTIALSFAVMPTDARIYWTQDVLNANRPGKMENAANQTLRGALSRLLHTENVQDAWLLAALIVAVLGIFLAVRAYRRDGDDAGGFALCALTGLLVSPISWTHHWVEAIPALMLVLFKAYRSRSTPLLVGCLAAAAVGYSQITWRVPVSNFTQTVELHENAVQLLCSNAYVIVALAALAWTAAAAWRTRGKAPVAP